MDLANDGLDLEELVELLNAESEEQSEKMMRNSSSCKEDVLISGEQTDNICSRLEAEQDNQDNKNYNELEEELRKMKEKMQLLEAELTQKKMKEEATVGTTSQSSIVDTSLTSSTRNIVQNKKTTSKQNNIHSNIIKDISQNIFDPHHHVQSSSTNGITSTIVKSNKMSMAESERSSSEVHTGDTDSSDDESNRYPTEVKQLTEMGQLIKRRIAHLPRQKNQASQKTSWTKMSSFHSSTSPKSGKSPEENIETDPYSGIRIIKPLVSSAIMKARMEGRRMVRMSLIRNCMRGGDIEGDWVTVGVITHKTDSKTSSKTGKTFSVWKMSDLRDCSSIISLFLFGEVYQQHWKASIGTVVGILNASIMPKQENSKFDNLSLTVDHPGKLMIMGSSKDFGYCKGKRKDGHACSAFVNMAQCEFCQYHVHTEYKKLSSKRVELQNSYSGVEPKKLNKRVFQNSGIMYGGQFYTTPPPARRSSAASQKCNSKDKLTLSSLKLKRKAEEIEKEPKRTANQFSHLTSHENQLLNEIADQSKFLGERLSVPSTGSRNLLKHYVKEEETEKVRKGEIKSITPKQLLQMHTKQLQTYQHEKRLQGCNANVIVTPKLGKGCRPGDEVFLDFPSPLEVKSFNQTDLAKLKAVQIVKKTGSLEKKDPNAVKRKLSPTLQEKVKSRVERDHSIDKEGSKDTTSPEQNQVGRLGNIDINSEEFQKILRRKSSHAYEVETCGYTAQNATDVCKNENHPLSRHKGKKRFFCCTSCSHRTFSFNKYPAASCKNCGGSNFERTGMMKPRKGPQLENEKLVVRGEEVKFLNSLK
ncbi:minichromosome maintenance 10 homolog isoform X2 [Tachypleus tridentatus]|uniref:minichromosome maintenance 10 homolog isoform X2 n=1 Tax=Tachypleus tridentatus TaxID=6853 RepID=UPI003FD2D02D